MTQEQDEFAERWLGRLVRPLQQIYTIPDGCYKVTAALYEFGDNGETIFAIMHSDYNPPHNTDFFTIRIPKGKVEEHLGDFIEAQ
jgi:hypothetical protein